MKAEFDPDHAKAHGYTLEDWKAIESPELTAEELAAARPLAEAAPALAKRLETARRGRPPSDNPKQMVSMRLDRDLVVALRASGRGWQTRVNEMLRAAVGIDQK